VSEIATARVSLLAALTAALSAKGAPALVTEALKPIGAHADVRADAGPSTSRAGVSGSGGIALDGGRQLSTTQPISSGGSRGGGERGAAKDASCLGDLLQGLAACAGARGGSKP
jgi:hypothetical protein